MDRDSKKHTDVWIGRVLKLAADETFKRKPAEEFISDIRRIIEKQDPELLEQFDRIVKQMPTEKMLYLMLFSMSGHFPSRHELESIERKMRT